MLRQRIGNMIPYRRRLCLLNRFLRWKQVNYFPKIIQNNWLGWEGITFLFVVVVFVCLSCLFVFFSWLIFRFSLTFLKFWWRYIALFILKSIFCSVLDLYYFAVFEFNAIKNYMFILKVELKKMVKKSNWV